MSRVNWESLTVRIDFLDTSGSPSIILNGVGPANSTYARFPVTLAIVMVAIHHRIEIDSPTEVRSSPANARRLESCCDSLSQEICQAWNVFADHVGMEPVDALGAEDDDDIRILKLWELAVRVCRIHLVLTRSGSEKIDKMQRTSLRLESSYRAFREV